MLFYLFHYLVVIFIYTIYRYYKYIYIYIYIYTHTHTHTQYFQSLAFSKLKALIHNSNNTLSLSLKANTKILIIHCHTNRGLVAHRHLFLRYCIAGYSKMPCWRVEAVNIGKEVQFKEDGHAQKSFDDEKILPPRTLMV